MNAFDGSIQMIKSGLMVFGFCPAGSTERNVKKKPVSPVFMGFFVP